MKACNFQKHFYGFLKFFFEILKKRKKSCKFFSKKFMKNGKLFGFRKKRGKVTLENQNFQQLYGKIDRSLEKTHKFLCRLVIFFLSNPLFPIICRKFLFSNVVPKSNGKINLFFNFLVEFLLKTESWPRTERKNR